MRQARDEWQTRRQLRMREEVHRLIFLDETATTTKMTRLRGRARHGARLKAKVPSGHWATQTFIAGLRCDGLTAPQLLALTAIGGVYFLVSLLRFRKVLATFQLHGSRRWSLSSPDLLRQADEHMRNTKSPIAEVAVRQIAALYAIEATVRGTPPQARLAARRQHTAPIIAAATVLAREPAVDDLLRLHAGRRHPLRLRPLGGAHPVPRRRPPRAGHQPGREHHPGCGSDEELSYASAIWGQSCWLAMLGDASRAKVAVFAIFYRAC